MFSAGMISWHPCVSVLRHCNVAKLIIPTGSMLVDFKIEHIHYTNDDIQLELLYKDHFLRTEAHNIVPQVHLSHQKVERPVFLS
jgi:hypothetical protein